MPSARRAANGSRDPSPAACGGRVFGTTEKDRKQ